MKVCGFTFIRNAIKFDFPIVEAITSVLPLCDKFVVAVGNSEDKTLQLIKDIGDSRIEIVETIWDDSLREGGKVLAVETDKAFDAISSDFDWCIYIQGDEAIHEKYHEEIKTAMEKYLQDPNVEGLLFKYIHFYGTYQFIGDSRSWYRNEIRVIRNNKKIRSYKDAQGFRIENRKLQVKAIDAYIYHYGWVKPPRLMQEKIVQTSKFWHDDKSIAQNIATSEVFDFSKVDSISKYTGTHPSVMKERLARYSVDVNLDPGVKKFKFKDFILYKIEKATGLRLWEYKNYKLI